MNPTPPSDPPPYSVNGEGLPSWLVKQEFVQLMERRAQAGINPRDPAVHQAAVRDAMANAAERLLLMRHAEESLPVADSRDSKRWRSEWLASRGGLAGALKEFGLARTQGELLERIIRMEEAYHRLTQHFLALAPEPGEPEIAACHAAHAERFVLPGHAEFRQVFRVNEGDPLDELTLLLHARDSLRKGVPLAQVATAFGNPRPPDPEKVYAVSSGPIDPEWQRVVDAVFALEPGAVSDVVETARGRHVLQAVRVQPGVRPALGEIRDIVAMACKQEWVETELGRLADSLVATADIRGFTVPSPAQTPAL